LANRDVLFQSRAGASETYAQSDPLAQSEAVTETTDQPPAKEEESSEHSSCLGCSKRTRHCSPPPTSLSPPTQEELVEWVFSHPDEHPSELASAVLAARGMHPIFSSSLAQQVDQIRRVMVHFSRL